MNSSLQPDGTDFFSFVHEFESWEDYLTKMRQDGTWGDHMILHAAANYYETGILIISNLPRNDDITITPYQSEFRHLLVLGHVHELHFVSLRPIEGRENPQHKDSMNTQCTEGWGGEMGRNI